MPFEAHFSFSGMEPDVDGSRVSPGAGGEAALKKILIIHTGGTIGMFPTDHGYAPSRENFHRVLASIPELSADSMPKWDLVDMDPLLDSSNISVNEWNKIGTLIAAYYDRYDGFVVLHGTDTMM